ncbi:DUF1254 domain-containing protein [Paraburkholderia bengalensis]|uniref:DUF1254 domain-containing protein n=1 Tax=Paraburkholderia bengalensis TaxID=2747562 RepID=A0ABU8IUD8_9BURK
MRTWLLSALGACLIMMAPLHASSAQTRITEPYARMVARDAYFWAWPLVNIYNRRKAFEQAPEVGLMNGVLPFAPLNRMSMLHDYIEPDQRWVACPNQDTVYGAGIAALDKTPVVIQVPDFGNRFWVYQIVDLRTDSIAELGKMYGSKPGFYLIAGPNWKGTVPKGIQKVFRSTTGTAFVVPRLFQDDTEQDRRKVQAVIGGIGMYPLAEYDGKVKWRDWTKLPRLVSPTAGNGSGETQWVFPDTFFDELPAVLRDAPPMPGEEARYAEALAVVTAAQKDPALKKAIVDEAGKADAEVVRPLLQFQNFGLPLPYHWSTIDNGAAFGTDYFTRTAVAKSNILVNKARETKYFYQDLDSGGQRLNGANRYTMTFGAGQAPPVSGFWSLTLYDADHFFVENAIKRYSVGTKTRDLRKAADGSVTIYVQPDKPADPAQRANWLPSPAKGDFSLYIRTYGPARAIVQGAWTPPAVRKVQ